MGMWGSGFVTGYRRLSDGKYVDATRFDSHYPVGIQPVMSLLEEAGVPNIPAYPSYDVQTGELRHYPIIHGIILQHGSWLVLDEGTLEVFKDDNFRMLFDTSPLEY